VRALIIDDSRAIRGILRKFLQELGFEVFEAGDGKEALSAMSVIHSVDLALVDWEMPVMTGVEFVRAVRAEHAYDSMRLMMVTTKADMDDVTQALAAGADEYVMKPFTKEVIEEKLTMMGVLAA
jgi:two-component system chemotaxis response regulator CheY